MNSKISRKLNEWRAVKKVFDNYSALVATLFALQAVYNKIVNKLLQIDASGVVQAQDSKGATLTKNVTKTSLVDEALLMVGAVIAYAIDTHNLQLQQSVKFSRSALLKKKDSLLGDVCQMIHDITNGIIAILGNYGITALNLATFQTDIINFTNLLGTGKSIRSIKHGATVNMDKMSADMDVLFEAGDRLMIQFKASQPEFYNAYLQARKIDSIGVHKISIKGVIREKDSKRAIAGAIIQNDEKGLSLTSTRKGRFRIKSLDPGKYKIVVRKKGYADQTVTIAVENGVITAFDIDMTKL